MSPDGMAKPCFNTGISVCPPARKEPSDWALKASPASVTVFGFWYSKFCIVQPRMTFAPVRTASTMFW